MSSRGILLYIEHWDRITNYYVILFPGKPKSQLPNWVDRATEVCVSTVFLVLRHFLVFLPPCYRARLPQRELTAAVVLGKRYGGVEAKTSGIVDEVAPPEELREAAITAANRLAGPGLDRRTVSALKHDLYRDIVLAMSQPPKYYSHIPMTV